MLAELVHQTTASTITRPKFDLAHGGHYKPLQNSPIYYLNLVKHVVLTTSRPFGMKGTGNSQPYRRKNSNLYKLPLKFVSNAKPIDIIHGKYIPRSCGSSIEFQFSRYEPNQQESRQTVPEAWQILQTIENVSIIDQVSLEWKARKAVFAKNEKIQILTLIFNKYLTKSNQNLPKIAPSYQC